MLQIDNVVNPGEDLYVLIGGEDPLHASIERFRADEISTDKEGTIYYIDKSNFVEDVRISNKNVLGRTFDEVNKILHKLLHGELKWEEIAVWKKNEK